MTGAGGRVVRLSTGAALTLTPVLARAGEGVVYGVAGRRDWAVKVFHPELKGLPDKLDKVAAMIRSAPPGAVQPNGFTVLTWPSELVFDDGGPLGFVMPRIDTGTAVELHTMSNPTNREDPLPSAPQWIRRVTWGHLMNTAANLCLAVDVVHRVDAVVGDFQERNILVSDTTEVTLVDCDSMQFTDAAGHRFLCGVGRPEFTAPELAGVDLRTQPREKSSDLFALAVHIHQLLMAGNHPFMRGTWTAGGEQPDALALARSGSWAGGPGSALRTHPLAPPITFLPPDIQRLFVRAFTHAAEDPAARPTAGEWRDALLSSRIGWCSGAVHQIPEGTRDCPWCAIDAERARRRRGTHPSPAVGAAALPRAAGAPRAAPPAVPTPATSVSTRWTSAWSELPQGSKLIVAGLAGFMMVVILLTSFIVWAILSGAWTFGS